MTAYIRRSRSSSYAGSLLWDNSTHSDPRGLMAQSRRFQTFPQSFGMREFFPFRSLPAGASGGCKRSHNVAGFGVLG